MLFAADVSRRLPAEDQADALLSRAHAAIADQDFEAAEVLLADAYVAMSTRMARVARLVSARPAG